MINFKIGDKVKISEIYTIVGKRKVAKDTYVYFLENSEGILSDKEYYSSDLEFIEN